MAATRLLRFDAEGRALEFPSWLIRAERFLKSQRQDNDTLWAHASGDCPSLLPPLLPLVLSLMRRHSLHLPRQPSPRDRGGSLLSAAFDCTADLITHVRSLDVSYRAACTEAELALLPPPMAITIHFIATSLPDRLAPTHDALLRKHPSALTIDVLETSLLDIESNIRSVASSSVVVTAAVSTTGGRSMGKGGKRGGKGGGAGGGGGGGRGPGATSASGGGDIGGGTGPAGPTGGGPGAAVWCSSSLLSGYLVDQGVLVVAVVCPARRHRCSAQLTDRVRAQYGFGPTPDWAPLARSRGLALWDLSAVQLVEALDYVSMMYADVDYSAAGSVCTGGRSIGSLPVASVANCLSSLGACVAALSVCVATRPSAPPGEASLSFTLDSGPSQCFFCDHTTLTPLLAPVPVALADPSSRPAVARSSTTLPCPVVPSGVLCDLHIPSFTRNLVGAGYLQDRRITVTFVGGGRTAVCTDAVVVPGQVAVSSQVAASGKVAASCSCWALSHPTVLWHHRLGHPSIPRLRSMASHRLVSFADRLRATPHSSSLRPATAPFQNLHLDAWGPAPTQGSERERYFLVVVDDYSRYTIVFPLAKKSEVTSTLIQWLLATEGTHGSRVSCLHSDRGGDFRSGILRGFCGEQGISQSWTLPESLQ
ncbi:unnamed protein product [Closterium sp. NIES-53]